MYVRVCVVPIRKKGGAGVPLVGISLGSVDLVPVRLQYETSVIRNTKQARCRHRV